MRNLLSKITWVFTALFGLCIAPVVGQFFVELAQERGAYNQPWEKLQWGMNSLSSITSSWWFGLALGYLGGSVVALWILRLFPEGREAKSAFLKLQTYGPAAGRNPDATEERNVVRWHYMDSTYEVVRADGTKTRTVQHTFVLVVFDRPIPEPRCTITSQDMALPPHEARFSNEHYIYLIFNGPLPMGFVNIDVQSKRK